jgi:hypothetical protein
VRKFAIAAVSIAAVALFSARANAQTMGEYATTTAGVASGGGSMGTGLSVPTTFGSDETGGSRTWGTSATGGSWAERVGAAGSADAHGDFSSRASAISSGASGGESRWPGGVLAGGGGLLDSSSGRFSTGDRFQNGDRFAVRDWANTDRFPAGSFHDREGLDNSYERGGLDNSYSTGGLDNSYNPANSK